MDEIPIIRLSTDSYGPMLENGTHLGIVMSEAEHLPSPGSSPELDKRQICREAASGNWSDKASSYFEINPHWWRISLSARGITALHVAVSMGNTTFVEKLVAMDCVNGQDLDICMADGNTAFCLAVITGNVKISEILLGKNPRLLWIRGQKDMLPIQLASSAGHIPMTDFLFQKTQEDIHNSIPFEDILKLFFSTIDKNIYSVTSKLLDRYPKLATIQNEKGLTPLQMLAQFSLFHKTTGHQEIASSLFNAMDNEKECLKYVQLSTAMFDAAKSGNIKILEFLLKDHPDLLFEVDSKEQRSLLHIAILYRQESVYRLILNKGQSKNVMIQLLDFEGNNVLHLAGMAARPEGRFVLSTDHVQMRSEERWFQKVEKIVPPVMKTMKNKEGLTPKELFYQSHKELHKEAVSEVKDAANTLIVVATLVISLGISAGMTLSVDDIDGTQTPIFPKKTWYTLFFLSIAFGIGFCASSMFFYASAILPSSWEPKEDSLHLRQTKLVFGNITLGGSIAIMFIAIASGSILIFEFLSNWILYFLAGLGGVVFVVHLTLDHKRWILVFHSVLSHCRDFMGPTHKNKIKYN